MLHKIPQLFHTIFKTLFFRTPPLLPIEKDSVGVEEKTLNLPTDNAAKNSVGEGSRNLRADDAAPVVVSIPISKVEQRDIPQEYKQTQTKVVERVAITVQFLGKFRVVVNGKPLILNGKNALIFASLLLDFQREIHKETLMQRFWADSLSAKNCLNVAICNIRKALKELHLEHDIIVFDSDFYSLSRNIQMETDLDAFTAMRREAMDIMRRQDLATAIPRFEKLVWLYNGDFLENYPNDTWALAERDTYSEYYFEALRLLSEHYEKAGNTERCIEYCRLMLRQDPHFEPIHRRLMVAYSLLGLKDKAHRQYQDCIKALKQINAAPSLETQKIFKELSF